MHRIVANMDKARNNSIKTNPDFAKKIVDHFSQQFQIGDTFLEPCRGDGAFYDLLPSPKSWCEIDKGRDFLTYDFKEKTFDWCITNLPWSAKPGRYLAQRSYQICSNVVQVIRLQNIFGIVCRMHDYLDHNHYPKEIIIAPWKGSFIGKRPEGFSLMVLHTQKDYTGDCKFTYWTR